MRAYSDSLSSAHDLVEDISQLSPDEQDEAFRGVLQAIAIVVRAYHRKRDVTINANYMVPEPGSEALLKAALFCDKRRQPASFRCFLVLKLWAYAPGPLPYIVLPVDNHDDEDSQQTSLFGAPWSFANGRASIIRDTQRLKKHLRGYENRKTRAEITEYFRKHRDHLRSFASLPIETPKGTSGFVPNQVIGVLNIDSSKTAVLGLFNGNQRKLHVALIPYLNLLAKLIVRRHYAAGTRH